MALTCSIPPCAETACVSEMPRATGTSFTVLEARASFASRKLRFMLSVVR
jgi:hypothetical protein